MTSTMSFSDLKNSLSNLGFESPQFVGEGSSGQIYKCKFQNQEVAVKILKDTLSWTAEQFDLFRREVASQACVSHPAIAKVFDSGKIGQGYYLVTEFIEGQTLQDLIRSGPLDQKLAVDVGRAIAGALVAIHQTGFVHRDIKPGNIMVGKNGAIKLIDFGLLARPEESTESNQSIAGTLLYASPEQLGLIKKGVDGRADLYSLGMSLYHCVLGRPAFDDSNMASLMDNHLKTMPALLNDLKPGLSLLFASIINKLILKEPDQRYDSAAQLYFDFANFPELEKEFKVSNAVKIASRKSTQKSGILVGRKPELTLLRENWVSAKNGTGTITLISGESGSGKTRLVFEMFDEAEAQNAYILRGKNEEGGAHPLGALNHAIDDHFHRQKALDLGHYNQEKAIVKSHFSKFPKYAARLSLHFQDLFSDSELAVQGDPNDEQFISVVSDFYLQFFKSKKNPCLFFIDDIQWMTQVALRILGRLMLSAEKSNLMIVMTGRSEDDRTQIAAQQFQIEIANRFKIVELGKLNLDAIVEIVSFRLGGRNIPEKLDSIIFERSKGNPYLVEQYVRTLIDLNVVFLERGQWSLDQGQLSRVPLPGNILDIVISRIEQLEDTTKEFLQAASVYGIQFKKSILHKMLGWNDIQVTNAIQVALRFGLVEIVDSNVVQFSHDKIIESLSASLAPENLKRLHSLAAKTLQSESNYDVLQVASHVLLGNFEQDPAESMSIALKAGQEAWLASSNNQAKIYFEFARSFEKFLSLSDETYSEIDEMLGKISRRLGEAKSAIAFFDLALSKNKNKLREARIHTEKADIYFLMDLNLEMAWVEYIKSVDALGEPFPEKKGPAFVFGLVSYLLKCFWYSTLGQFKKAGPPEKFKYMSVADRVAAFHANFTNRPDRLVFLMIRSWYCSLQLGKSPESVTAFATFTLFAGVIGKLKLVEKFGKTGLEIADAVKDPFLKSRMELDRAMAFHMAGELVRAEGICKQLIESNQQNILLEDYFRLTSDLLINLTLRGYSKDAIRYSELAIRKAKSIKSHTRDFVPYCFSASALALAGKFEMASESYLLANESLRISTELERNPFALAMAAFGKLMYCLEKGGLDAEVDLIIEKFEALKIPSNKAAALQRPAIMAIALARFLQYEADRSEDKKNRMLAALERFRLATKSPQTKCFLALIEGKFARAEAKIEEAEAFFLEAERLAKHIDSKFALYEIYLERARISRNAGNQTAARESALLAWDTSMIMGWSVRAERVAEEFSIQTGKARQGTVMLNRNLNVQQGSADASIDAQKRYSEALHRVSQVMSGIIDPEEQARLALDEIIQLLRAERGFFLSVNKENGELKVQIGRNEKKETLPQMEGFSRSVIAKVHKTKEPLIMVGDENGEYSGVESIISQGLKSIIAVPMFLRSEYVGIAYFDSNVVKGLFSKEDLDICRGIGSHISVAQEMAKASVLESQRVALRKDLELTGSVQKLFFPEMPYLKTSKMILAGVCVPTDACSGDWWWFEEPTQNRLRVIVADVMGHGAPSAMVTAALVSSTRIRLQGQDTTNTGNILKLINSDIASITRGEYCSTLTLVELNFIDNKAYFWTNGAPPIIIEDKEGNRNLLQENSSLIGVKDEDYNFGYIETPFNPGDRICLVSDGFYEAVLPSNEELGIRRFSRMIGEAKAEPAEAAILKIIEKVHTMTQRKLFGDDATLILVDRLHQDGTFRN